MFLASVPAVLMPERFLSRFRLSVAALGDWLRNPEKQEQGTGQQEETLADDSDLVSSHSKIRNIWNKDLLLENATDRYVAHETCADEPTLTLCVDQLPTLPDVSFEYRKSRLRYLRLQIQHFD